MPDLCESVFSSRCVWCTGLSYGHGVELRWSRSSWTLCAAWFPACWWTTVNIWSSPLTSKMPLSPCSLLIGPSGLQRRSELNTETLAWAQGRQYAAFLTCFFLIKSTFCFLSKDPSGHSGVPPAAVLGEEVPPGRNQTHNPKSESVGEQSIVDVREA